MIDIEKLHKDYGKKSGRASGRTFDTIVAAIHQADFCTSPSVILIIVHNEIMINVIMNMIHDIATDLSFQYEYVRKGMVKVNGLIYVIDLHINLYSHPSMFGLNHHNLIMFEDHYKSEVLVGYRGASIYRT